jgi:hypothetical protein
MQLYSVKACVVWISRGLTPLIPNLGNKWRWWELSASHPGRHLWSPQLKAGLWSWLVRSRSFEEDKSHLLLATNPDSVVVQPVTWLPFWYYNVSWNVIVRLVVKAVSVHPFTQWNGTSPSFTSCMLCGLLCTGISSQGHVRIVSCFNRVLINISQKTSEIDGVFKHSC